MACVALHCNLRGASLSSSKTGHREGEFITSSTNRRCKTSNIRSRSRRGFGLAVGAAEAKEVKVCTKKVKTINECKRMGSLKTLAKFEALLESREGLEVEVTTVNCLGECGMGPNVQINGDNGPIVNGVKSEEHVAKVVDRLLGE